MRIIKRDGSEVPFDREKIRTAIASANAGVAEADRLSGPLLEYVVSTVERQCEALGRAISVEEIQDMIEDELIASNHTRLMRRYSDYRLRHALLRKQNTTDKRILALLRHDSEIARQENANKDAELNTKSDYCQVCGYDGEIKIVEEDGKLVWECPKCGNRDERTMNVCRRVCGYLGTNYFNQGRTQEIAERVLHL